METYRHAQPSCPHLPQKRQALSIVGGTGPAHNGDRRFLTARALQPSITAKGLRAVSDIVAARYYVPPSMLARILREADPVATVSPGAVRFEGFSACCSVYARLDLGDGALEVSHRANGTTNVDFGPKLRGALAAVRDNTKLDISIDAATVGVTANNLAIVEKKVPLPLRWIRGFADVQVVMSGMRPAFRMCRVSAQQFLRNLPRGKNDQLQWIVSAHGSARLSTRRIDGAVPLRGSHRLQVIERMAARSEGLDVFVNDATGASGWVLDFGGQRFLLVLNAEPWRGFSGDGGVLSKIANSDKGAVAKIRAQLNWQDVIDPDDLASATALSETEVKNALAELAAMGIVGFDLAQAGYFHRVLPFDLEQIETANPRLRAARELVEASAVQLTHAGAEVRSQDVIHTVTWDDDGWRCTCPWFARNGPKRGPCKHVLAAEIALEKPS